MAKKITKHTPEVEPQVHRERFTNRAIDGALFRPKSIARFDSTSETAGNLRVLKDLLRSGITNELELARRLDHSEFTSLKTMACANSVIAEQEKKSLRKVKALLKVIENEQKSIGE